MEKLLSNVKAVLSTSPARWQSLVETIPIELLTRRPVRKEWSALQCLQHVLDCERLVFPVRVQAILAGENIPAFDQDTEQIKKTSQMSPVVMLAEFISLRAANFKLLAKVTDEDLPRTAIHSELGQITLSELLHVWAGHDLMHIVQTERAIMQPFILAKVAHGGALTSETMMLKHLVANG